MQNHPAPPFSGAWSLAQCTFAVDNVGRLGRFTVPSERVLSCLTQAHIEWMTESDPDFTANVAL